MLDDKDEFGPLPLREGIVLLPAFVYGNHKARLPGEYWMPPPSQLKKRVPVPKLFAYQKALLALLLGGEVSEVGEPKEKPGKGRPDKRETPLLSNTPRTTPKTVKYLLDRQHSTSSTSHALPLDDVDVFGPSLTDRFQSFRFDEAFLRHRLGDRI